MTPITMRRAALFALLMACSAFAADQAFTIESNIAYGMYSGAVPLLDV